MTGIDGAKLTSLLEEMLSKPVSNHVSPTKATPVTREVVRRGDTLEVTVPEVLMEDSAADSLTAEGLDPALWEVTGFRRSEWGEGKVSTRFTYRRRKDPPVERQALTEAELGMLVEESPRARTRGHADSTRSAIVCVSDLQVGKAENGAADLVSRTLSLIDDAVAAIDDDPRIGDVTVAFLGDEIEGFVSQGGANIWRTPLALMEQIRIVRRVMLYALVEFHRLGLPLRMLAVPGNHDSHRFKDGGITTYDDSHDTEALLSVMDGARLGNTYGDVAFHVPETDELAVSLDLSGTHCVFFHGHMARSQQKTMDWLKGQAFRRGSLFEGFHVALSGHWHSHYLESSGDRTYITAPTLEAESTWYKHRAGSGGAPGLLLLTVSGGKVRSMEVLTE